MKQKKLLIFGVVMIVLVALYRLQKTSKPIEGLSDSTLPQGRSNINRESIRLDPSRPNPAFKPNERKGIQSIPADKVEQVKTRWTAEIGNEGFKTSEFDFKRGHIRSERTQNSNLQVGVWSDISGKCRLEINMIEFVPSTPGRMYCLQ